MIWKHIINHSENIDCFIYTKLLEQLLPFFLHYFRSQSEVRNDTSKLLLDPIDTYPTRSLTVQSERSSERIPSISWSVHPTSPLSSKSPTGTLSHENMDGNAGFFMVEVKLLSDEEVPLQLEVTVSLGLTELLIWYERYFSINTLMY